MRCPHATTWTSSRPRIDIDSRRFAPDASVLRLRERRPAPQRAAGVPRRCRPGRRGHRRAVPRAPRALREPAGQVPRRRRQRADPRRGGPGAGRGGVLRLGRGERATGGQDKSSILSDALEAIIGAVYLDCGLSDAAGLVHRLLDVRMVSAAALGAGLDWKTSLQELGASTGTGVPRYEVTATGPDHDASSLLTVVHVGDAVHGEGPDLRRSPSSWPPRSAYREIVPAARSLMPELPEVEMVRRGLAARAIGRGSRRGRAPSAGHQAAGPGRRVLRRGADRGHRFTGTGRRGKYLWWPPTTPTGARRPPRDERAVPARRSGDSRRSGPAAPHARVRFDLDDRLALRSSTSGPSAGCSAPWCRIGRSRPASSHIAPDPTDPAFDVRRWPGRCARRAWRSSGAARADLVSGIGNIYADEALWRVRIHPRRATLGLAVSTGVRLLSSAEEVMPEAIVAGGTSFDPLYVNVNGESGWFARDLAAYGRAGEPCRRCGRRIARERFMNRSSYLCPRCQRLA